MGLIHFVRHFLLWLKYRRAAIVNSREELEAALLSEPPRIVVEGNDALRAYAANLVQRESETVMRLQAEAPDPPAPGDKPVYMLVPKVGRIRDGYRNKTKKKAKPGKRLRLKGGVDSVLVVSVGIFAVLLIEWLSFPDLAPRMIRGPHRPGHISPITPVPPPPAHPGLFTELAIPVLALIALGCLLWFVWQQLGIGRPVQTEWRLEHRIPGRLVMARVRRRVV